MRLYKSSILLIFLVSLVFAIPPNPDVHVYIPASGTSEYHSLCGLPIPMTLECQVEAYGGNDIDMVCLYITDNYLNNYGLSSCTSPVPSAALQNVTFPLNLAAGDYRWNCWVNDSFNLATWGNNSTINLQYDNCGGGGGDEEPEVPEEPPEEPEDDEEEIDEFLDEFFEDLFEWLEETFESEEELMEDAPEEGPELPPPDFPEEDTFEDFVDWWDDLVDWFDDWWGFSEETYDEEDLWMDDLEHDDDRYADDIDWGEGSGEVTIDFGTWPDRGDIEGDVEVTITDIETGEIVFEGELEDGESIDLPYGDYLINLTADGYFCFGRTITISERNAHLYLALIPVWVLFLVILFLWFILFKRKRNEMFIFKR